MRLAIYVPKALAERWSPSIHDLSFDAFQREVIDLTGAITVTSATHRWTRPTASWAGIIEEPVFIVEALIRIPDPATYRKAWELFRRYARQLIAENGGSPVLIVQDNEPVYVTA